MTASMMTTSAPLCPDKPGGRRCIGHGTFLGMKQTSGWIHPIEEIDHPFAQSNWGDIYISEKDVFPGVTLKEGDSVVFYLYVDGKGLGAENCVPVWHEQAQAMKAMKSVQETSFASAFFAMSTILQAQAQATVMASSVVATPEHAVMPKNMAVDLSSFYDDDDSDDSDDDEESDSDDTNGTIAKPTTISLSDILIKSEPQDFPSVGSALHAVGTCKQCSFFPKGTCTNGAACEFCHFGHAKGPRTKAKKGQRVRERQKAHLARDAAAKRAAPNTPPSREPMKISPSLVTPKQLFPNAARERSPTTCDSTDEGSGCEGSDSSTWGSPLVIEREPISAPPGLAPPPPNFPPPQAPEFLSVSG